MEWFASVWELVSGFRRCCSAQRDLNDPGRGIFVLSAHCREVDVPSSCASSEDDPEHRQSSTPAWGMLRWLAGFSATDPSFSAGKSEAASKGGLCTQSLVYALRENTRAASHGRSMTLAELLSIMHRVLLNNGCPSAVVTLRSSIDISRRSQGAPLVAQALPHAARCGMLPKALLIGICYTELPDWKLAGAWNDVGDLRAWLISDVQWPATAIRVLKDDGCGAGFPTRQAILEHLEWLFDDEPRSVEHDGAPHRVRMRLLHFCGHGDLDQLFPMDWLSAGPIRGSELADIVSSRLREGETFTCVLDCCQSSSLLRDLSYEMQLCEPTDR